MKALIFLPKLVKLFGYTFLLTFITSGCFLNNEKENSEQLVVQIRSHKKTNRGTPLYVVVKETSMADFLIDDYHQIATQSFWKEESEKNLFKKVLIPGKIERLKVDLSSEDKSIGLYFIFTNPGECWKYFIDKPKSKNVKILLGDHEYEAINVYEH